jgi:hypothetical protein
MLLSDVALEEYTGPTCLAVSPVVFLKSVQVHSSGPFIQPTNYKDSHADPTSSLHLNT